jgi:hypothetical protein
MKRRAFVTLLAGAAAVPVLSAGAARVQQKGAGRLVGVIMSGAESQARIAPFHAGLEGLGWKSGQSIRITYRLCGPYPEGRQSRRSAGAGVGKVRFCHKCRVRQDAGSRLPPNPLALADEVIE